MPSKYSHSAVLAQYSSRGMISLPNDQHLAYMNSATAIGYTPTTSRSRAQSFKSQLSNPADTARSLRSQVSHDRLPPRGYQHISSTNTAQRRLILDSDSEEELAPVHVHGSPIHPRSDWASSTPHKIPPPPRGAAGREGQTSQESTGTKSLSLITQIVATATPADRAGNAAVAPKEEREAPQLPNGKLNPPRNFLTSTTPAVSEPRIQSVRNRNSGYKVATQRAAPLPSEAEFDELSDTNEPDFIRRLHVAGPPSSTATQKAPSRIISPSDNRPDARQSFDIDQLDREIVAPFQHARESRLNSISTLSTLSEDGPEFGVPSVVRSPKLTHRKRDSGAIVMNNATFVNHDSTSHTRTNSLLRRASNRVAPASKIIRPASIATNYDDKRQTLAMNNLRGSSATLDRDGIDGGAYPNIDRGRAPAAEPEAVACPPDISKYKMRNGIGSPLAQVEEILLMEQSLRIAQREEKIQEAERRLWELKHAANNGKKGGKYGQGQKSEAAIAAAAAAAEAKSNSGGFFRRLRAKSRGRKS